MTPKQEAATSKNALVYLRVSTEEQTENYSLQNQEASCLQEAQRRGLNVVRIFREEGKSAKTIQGRPTLLELLEVCRQRQKRVGAIIVHHIDRLSRQAFDYLVIKHRLAQYQIEIISVNEPTTNDPMGHFVETLFASIAQFDNELRSERARLGMQARFRAGLPNSAVPLGYFNQQSLVVIDQATFYHLQAAWFEMVRGLKSVTQLTRELNAQGVRSRNGKPLRVQNLLNIFRNKFYTGAIVSKKYGQEIHGQHPAMISEEVFFRVQAVLAGRRPSQQKNKFHRQIVHPNFPLRQLITCFHCGKGFTGSWTKGKRLRYAYYWCTGHCSEARSIPVKIIHDAMSTELAKLTIRSTAANKFIRFIRLTYIERSLTVQQRQSQFTQKAELIAQRRQKLLEQHFAGQYSNDVYQEQSKLLDHEMRELVVAKSIAMTTRYNPEEIIRFVQEKLVNVSGTYATGTVEQQRGLIRGLYPARLPWRGDRFVSPQIIRWYPLIARYDVKPQTEQQQFNGDSFEQMMNWLDGLRKSYYGIPESA